MVQAGSRLRSFIRRGAGGRRIEGIDSLMPEPGHFIMHQITADHAFGETRLVGLVNHFAVFGKILLTPSEEFAK